jgi:uncharacterized protein YndB with AHSA1/START domain
MGAQYHFVDRWFVPAPLEDVFAVIGDQLAYPRWWGDVFLQVTGDEGPPRPGRRARLVTRGFLPYRLRFEGEVVAADPPHGFSMRLSGDFEGEGAWSLTEHDGGTAAVLDWRPIVQKPGVKQLTPLLRPLFRANHDWAMRRGQAAIVRLFDELRAAAGVVETS